MLITGGGAGRNNLPHLVLGRAGESSQSVQDVSIDFSETKFFKHFH